MNAYIISAEQLVELEIGATSWASQTEAGRERCREICEQIRTQQQLPVPVK